MQIESIELVKLIQKHVIETRFSLSLYLFYIKTHLSKGRSSSRTAVIIMTAGEGSNEFPPLSSSLPWREDLCIATILDKFTSPREEVEVVCER